MASSSKHKSSADSEEEMNILLLGESGVGKSTFINSCFNYLKYKTLKDLMDGELQVLIPARISMLDMNRQQHPFDLNVNYGATGLDDVPIEVLEAGRAATQDVSIYTFSMDINNKKYKVRFLDTPGIGDERGAEKDKENCDLILGYLSQFKKIHGFGLLLHPIKNRLDVFFKYCIVEILSRLETSAVNNIAFIFTNTRGQHFTAGPTYTSLQVLLNEIKKEKNISIPLTNENIFCFDNEAFSYVAAIKNGVQLEPFRYMATEFSWQVSVKEFWRLLEYISHLKPHDLKKTISINDARAMASYLTQPLIEIVQLIQANIKKLKQHSEELSEAMLTSEELRKKMYTPRIDISVERLDSPYTVCAHDDCTDVYEVNGERKIHYKQICCTRCLTRYINIFSPYSLSLAYCWAFNGDGECQECHHDRESHKYITYKTKIFEEKVDESVLPEINSNEQLVKLKEEHVKSLEDRQREFKHEKQYILYSCTVLDQYLKKNSITSKEKPIKEYLKYRIDRENGLGQGDNDETVETLRGLLAEYEKEKIDFQSGRSAQNRDITPEDIDEIKRKLTNLKHFGPNIKLLYDLHESGKKALKKREKVVKSGKDGFFKKLIKDLF